MSNVSASPQKPTLGVARPLRVALAPGSAAHRAFRPPRPEDSPAGEATTVGVRRRPAWNLASCGGHTIADLTFINCYVGSAGAWSGADRENIDRALSGAMGDAALQSVIAQYYTAAISSRMLPSIEHDRTLAPTVYKDAVERLASELYAQGVLGAAQPASSVINIMLPPGIVLSTDPAPAGSATGGTAARITRTPEPGAPEGEVESAVESTHGLGGYHGSIALADGTKFYYAVGVYSQGENGIVAFDEPWKNVVATFYHELNEARTDADVEEVHTEADEHLLGWYSQTGGGEIGDLPINECGEDLGLVFKEVSLADGSGTVPIQLMWSNAAAGPAARA